MRVALPELTAVTDAEPRMLRVSEIFASVQGEGPSAGTPAIFLRLALCNLRCEWCDTRYTWDWAHYDFQAEVRRWSVPDVARRIDELGDARLVITGGEPLLQQRRIDELLAVLGPGRPVEVETNATITPTPALFARVTQWNVSPKLRSAGDSLERRIRKSVLLEFRACDRAWLKLVVDDDTDVAEADALLVELGWPRERVLFMPQAASRQALAERIPFVERAARARGLRVSSRLHVERFDGARGC